MKIGVFIGRLQPIHNAHLAAIKMALTKVERLVIVLGSDCSAKTVKNPWTSFERSKMIFDALSDQEADRVRIVFAKDYTYNDDLWVVQVQHLLSEVKFDDQIIDVNDHDVTLFGHKKDQSTYYLDKFPQWDFFETGDLSKEVKMNELHIDATKVRDCYFRKDLTTLKHIVSQNVLDTLREEMKTEEYQRLYDEYHHVQKYKQLWETAPYKPIFVTTDAIVQKSGHILVVRRKGHPGKGLIALPGGFIDQENSIKDNCIRELKEETKISIPKDELKKRIKKQKVFDHPNRSLRGRTITHAFLIDLGDGPLPKVKGSDDADKAWWMSLRDVMRQEEAFFEDHFHIINYFSHGGQS